MNRLLFVVLLGLTRPSAADMPPLALDCLSCHGEAAQSTTMAPLARLSPATIVSALRDYRDGRRSGSAMPRLAKPLSDAQIDAVAAALGRAP